MDVVDPLVFRVDVPKYPVHAQVHSTEYAVRYGYGTAAPFSPHEPAPPGSMEWPVPMSKPIQRRLRAGRVCGYGIVGL